MELVNDRILEPESILRHRAWKILVGANFFRGFLLGRGIWLA